MDSVAGMRIFVRVVESASFSAAARQLGVAPSSVSRQINELEESLGARLFTRTTRKLSLTEAGKLFYNRAGNILVEVDEARLAVSQHGRQVMVGRAQSVGICFSGADALLGHHPG